MDRDTLEWMLAALESNRLEVAKIKTASGYRRVVVSANCPWYRELCSRHIGLRGTRGGRFRRPRTLIRRGETVRALKRMLAGDAAGVYAERILAVASDATRR